MDASVEDSIGDRADFEELYRRTVARVHSLARRLLGRHEADEATQEVYLRAWRKLASFRGEADAATWLQRLALHAILNHRAGRRTRREHELGELDLDLLPARATDDAAAEQATLERAIAKLPDAARQVFVLREIEGLSHAVIAEQLGVSTGTTKSQLHRARELLRAELGDERERGELG